MKTKHLDDAQIVELFFERNEDAVSESEAKYGSYLRSIAYNILGNSSDAEECVSDTLADVWRKIPPARPESLKAFFVSVLRRRAVDSYRRSHRLRDIPSQLTASLDELEFLAEDKSDVHETFDTLELSRVINVFISSLPERRRYIFISRFYMARSIDEIARRLYLSRSSVNKELAHIRRDLREKLESEGYSV